MTRAITLTCVLLCASGAEDASQRAAVDAAESWLKLVDAGKYGASWDEAATLFKNAVQRSDWEKKVAAVRAPLGKVLSRKLSSKQTTHSLPGAPDGTYVVLSYETRFEHKEHAVETVTPMLETSGRWRVSGYFIR
jgi:Protein of unknown function (DUF4019)